MYDTFEIHQGGKVSVEKKRDNIYTFTISFNDWPDDVFDFHWPYFAEDNRKDIIGSDNNRAVAIETFEKRHA